MKPNLTTNWFLNHNIPKSLHRDNLLNKKVFHRKIGAITWILKYPVYIYVFYCVIVKFVRKPEKIKKYTSLEVIIGILLIMEIKYNIV